MLLFAPHNLLMDPPFTRLDILSCRNLLIYLAPSCRRNCCRCFTTASIRRFYSLAARRPLARPPTFSLPSTARRGSFGVWTALREQNRSTSPPRSCPRTPWDCRVGWADRRAQDAPNLQALAEQLLLQRHVPAAVLTNDTATSSSSAAAQAHTWSQQRASQLEHLCHGREGCAMS